MATPLCPEPLSFFDNNGDPLAGGKVYFYSPGTTTFKDTWQDASENTLNTNPVTLDGNGRAPIWIRGAYDMVVKTSAGIQVTSQAIQSDYDAVAAVNAGTASGTDDITIIPVAGAIMPKVAAYKTGLLVSAIAPNTTTGPVRAQYAGLGLKKVYVDANPPVQADADDIFAANALLMVYDETLDTNVGGWHLLSNTASLQSQIDTLIVDVDALEALRNTLTLDTPTSHGTIRGLNGDGGGGNTSILVEWGGAAGLAQHDSVTIIFPEAYATAAYSVVTAIVNTVGADGLSVQATAKTTTSVTFYNNSVPATGIEFNWLTIGGGNG